MNVGRVDRKKTSTVTAAGLKWLM